MKNNKTRGMIMRTLKNSNPILSAGRKSIALGDCVGESFVVHMMLYNIK
jgi:hypothetical protein